MHYAQTMLSLWTQLSLRISSRQRAQVAIGLASLLLLSSLWGQVEAFRLESPTYKSKKHLTTDTTSVALSEISQFHLFGKPETPTSPLGMPDTVLQWSLKGLYSGNEPNEGSAIISVPGKTDRVYLVGDKLPGGAILSGVYGDRVVIDRNGQLEVLKFATKGLEEKKDLY